MHSPAVLAVAEAERLTGHDLLLATALIYEVQCRFVEVVPYNHHGWDQTPVVALGAALGCARLLGSRRRERMRHAISLAVMPNIALNQTRTGTLSMWKGMAGPQGARAGVFAAYLAREGMTGPDGVFEGKYGFWNQMMNGEQFELPVPTEFSRPHLCRAADHDQVVSDALQLPGAGVHRAEAAQNDRRRADRVAQDRIDPPGLCALDGPAGNLETGDARDRRPLAALHRRDGAASTAPSRRR